MPVSEIIVGREPEDVEKYGTSGCAYIGKHIVGKGEDAHLTNRVLMDVVRPHVALILGKRGTGKCVFPDTVVHLGNGKKEKIENIFDAAKMTGKQIINDGCEELVAVKSDISVISFDINSKRFVTKNVSHIYKRKINENLIKIVTLKNEIIVTKEHPLLTKSGWKKAKSLKNNERVGRFSNSNLFWDKIISLKQIHYKGYVYDLTVPGTHNFVASNGIICHNSYTGAVMAEEIMSLPDDVKQNLSCLLIDTMGIFWSMKSPNEKDLPLLSEWQLKPRGFAIQNIVPVGLASAYEKSGIGYDGLFAIKPTELSAGDWALTFGLSLQEPLGILLERIIKKLKSENENYDIEQIIEIIERDKRSDEKEKLALENRFLAAKEWGIFSQEATPIEQFLKPGIATVLDISLQEWNVRNLMLGILTREIYEARTFARREEEIALIGGESIKKIPMTWIIMDEAHNFISAEGETAATHSLLTLVTQGRQPGISCVFITQRPNKLHETVIAQSDLIISHRLTAKPDLDALSSIMQTYLLSDIRKSISELPRGKGAALILDDNSERLYNIQVRPRQSWHAGGSPIALKEK